MKIDFIQHLVRVDAREADAAVGRVQPLFEHCQLGVVPAHTRIRALSAARFGSHITILQDKTPVHRAKGCVWHVCVQGRARRRNGLGGT